MLKTELEALVKEREARIEELEREKSTWQLYKAPLLDVEFLEPPVVTTTAEIKPAKIPAIDRR